MLRRSAQQPSPRPFGPIIVLAILIQLTIMVANLYFAVGWLHTSSAAPLINFAQILACSYLLVGTVVRHRGAWQMGLILSGLSVAVGWTTAASVAFIPHSFVAGGLALGSLHAVYFLLLVTPQSRRFFDLCCPYCQQFSEQPADIMFQKVYCTHCDITWTHSWELVPAEKLALVTMTDPGKSSSQYQPAKDQPADSNHCLPTTPYAEF